ncbi:MAG: HU family DNA-binding protein [Bacteroidales bacterium]|nr:HU family DNA-binding protein [Bacteroidales bacterium]
MNKRLGIKYYAVPVLRGQIDLMQIAKTLTHNSSLTESDVYATVIGMVSLIEEHLHNGYNVSIDGLGIFSLSASSAGFDTPEECTPHRVQARKICFRADVKLKKNLPYVKFERDKSP